VSPQSLSAGSASTEVYLKLGSSTSGAGRAYYSITSVHLSTTSARAGLRLRFDTSSLVLLGEILGGAANGGQISNVSLAFRTPGLSGRPTTESVDTFSTAAVASFREQLSGMPVGTISLVLPAASHVVSAPGPLQRVGPFAAPSSTPATKADVNTDTTGTTGATSSAVTAVQISQTAPHAPIHLSFTTSSLSLLDGIFQDQGAAVSIPMLTLAVRAEGGGSSPTRELTYTFSALSVGSFAESNLSGALSGTATLVVRP
jgi:hypothetical protein